MKKEKIQKIISTGGYMSLPLIFAAKIMNLDIYLIEPNQIIGRANRFFLKSCTKIFCYTDKIKNFPKEHINKIVVIKVDNNTNISLSKTAITGLAGKISNNDLEQIVFKQYPSLAKLKKTLTKLQNILFSQVSITLEQPRSENSIKRLGIV